MHASHKTMSVVGLNSDQPNETVRFDERRVTEVGRKTDHNELPLSALLETFPREYRR